MALSVSLWSTLQTFTIVFIITLFCLAVYRLYLHPLSKFPGPTLAALTTYYESYYDIIKGGKYSFKIRELHQKYGPIIRINPFELHVDDPDFYGVIYSREGRWDKIEWHAAHWGNTLAEVLTPGHEIHRARRAAVNPYFSKQKIISLEPLIQTKIEQLCSRISRQKGSGEPLPMRLAFECLTTDIITEYCLGKSYGNLEKPDWNPKYHETMRQAGGVYFLSKQLPFLHPLMNMLPNSMVLRLSPGMASWIDFGEDCVREVKKIQDRSMKDPTSEMEKSHPTVFHEIMYASDLPPSEKSLYRMRCEAIQFVSAGTDTVSNTMHVITFHLLDKPTLLMRLREELRTVQPDPYNPAPLKTLEQLPYLTSVILEGLRLGYGVSTRSARANPDRVIKYKQWEIPVGTPVSMTSILMHQNETVFPNSENFDPERWVDPADRQRLDKYMVAFSKGTRQCLGINLAWAELYKITAAVFSRFDLELYQTTWEDHVKIHSDMFFPHPRKDSGEMRVLVK